MGLSTLLILLDNILTWCNGADDVFVYFTTVIVHMCTYS